MISYVFIRAPALPSVRADLELARTDGKAGARIRQSQNRDAVFLSRERHANVRRGDRSYPVRAIRTREFLYVRNFEPDLWPAGDPEIYFAVGDYGDVDFTFTKQHILDHRDEPAMRKYFEINFGKRPAEELYDLAKDPDQTENVAGRAEHAAAKDQLAKRLTDWMRETADPRLDNPHHPTFGRENLASLLDRDFDGKSPIVVDGLNDARKDPITQMPIRPAKIPELIRFLEPVFAARDKQPEPRERLVVLNYVIVEQPRVKPPADWIKADADTMQRYAETALQRGASCVFFSEMVQPDHIQGGSNGNRFRRAGLQVFDELTSRKLPGIERGPTLQVLLEQHRHFFRDDRHYSDAGRDFIGLLWFETLLKHDGREVPQWAREEITRLQSGRPL